MSYYQALLVLFKFFGIGLTGLFGLLGLLTNYKDEGGRITRWGKIALLGTIASTGVAGLSQGLEFLKNAQDQATAAEEALKISRSNATIRRAVDPLDSLTATAWLELDFDNPKLTKYRERVASGVEQAIANKTGVDAKLPDGIFVSQSDSSGKIIEVSIPTGSELFPKKDSEALAYYSMRYIDLEVKFFDPASSPPESRINAINENRERALVLDFDTADSPGSVDIIYDVQEKKIKINASSMRSETQYWRNNSDILSIADLVGKTMTIGIRSIVVPSFENPTNEGILELRRQIKLESLLIELPRGRQFWIRQPRQEQGPNSLATYKSIVPDLTGDTGLPD
jgi:hypothetical protein